MYLTSLARSLHDIHVRTCNVPTHSSPQHDVGDYKFSARSEDFDGWLICDGRTLNRDEYPELYTIIGNSFGSPTSDTFDLPDCRGRVIGATGSSTGVPHILGAVVGTEAHALSVAEMPAHNHTGITNNSGHHNHGGTTGAEGSASESETVAAGSGAIVAGASSHNHTIQSDGMHGHSFVTDTTGNGQAFSIMQPTIFIGNVFIRAC